MALPVTALSDPKAVMRGDVVETSPAAVIGSYRVEGNVTIAAGEPVVQGTNRAEQVTNPATTNITDGAGAVGGTNLVGVAINSPSQRGDRVHANGYSQYQQNDPIPVLRSGRVRVVASEAIAAGTTTVYVDLDDGLFYGSADASNRTLWQNARWQGAVAANGVGEIEISGVMPVADTP